MGETIWTAGDVASLNRWSVTFDAFLLEWKVVNDEGLSRSWMRLFGEAVARQEQLIVEGFWRSGPKSLLGVTGQRHLETVHSSVLAWLLDPNGWHGLGGRLLERFLIRCALSPELADPHVQVVTEEGCIHPETERVGSTDIVVHGRSWTLVIENKLWAGQSGDQLDLYYDAYAATRTQFVYLTPDGVLPRSMRPEVVKAFHPVSWRREVLPDLRKAIADCEAAGGRCPAAREYTVALEEELR